MKPERQRIKIAEACGWKPTTDGGICWDTHGNAIVTPPDYLNDLNAMHEAQKELSEDDQKSYRGWLVVVCNGNHWNAPASKRAEAFLRTLNLWSNES